MLTALRHRIDCCLWLRWCWALGFFSSCVVRGIQILWELRSQGCFSSGVWDLYEVKPCWLCVALGWMSKINLKKSCYAGGVVCVYRMFLTYVSMATADPSAGLPKGKAFTNKPCIPKDLKKNLASNAFCSSCHAGCFICRCGTSCPRIARRRETTSIIFCNPINSTSAKFYCSNFMIIDVGLYLSESSCACVRSVQEVTSVRWDSCSWEILLYSQPATDRESQKLVETRTNVPQWCK